MQHGPLRHLRQNFELRKRTRIDFDQLRNDIKCCILKSPNKTSLKKFHAAADIFQNIPEYLSRIPRVFDQDSDNLHTIFLQQLRRHKIFNYENSRSYCKSVWIFETPAICSTKRLINLNH